MIAESCEFSKQKDPSHLLRL